MTQVSKKPLLKIENLKIYAENNGRVLGIVNSVSFDIRENEVVALFGECGCGKTTVAYSIMGTIRYLPGVVEGKIYLNEEGNLLEGLDKISCWKDWKNGYENRMKKVRGKQLFLVMQGAKSSLNPFYKIKEQIKMVSGIKDVQKIDEILQKFQIKDMKDEYPHRLSGGECQRALLSMAFASHVELLIIDEPTVGIDEELKENLIKLLVQYKEGTIEGNSKSSLLLISHDLKVIESLADRIVVMCSGTIVEAGDKDEIIKNPKHPYTKMLIQSYQISTKTDQPLPVIKGAIPLFYKEHKGCKFYSRCEENIRNSRCLLEEPPITGDEDHLIRCYSTTTTHNTRINQ